VENTPETNQPMFLRIKEVAALIGIKPAAIDRAIRAGTFPRPFLIGVKAKGFSRSEIDDWMRQRDAARFTYSDPARPTTVDPLAVAADG
jgi:predicted DNA-binding transcriptional regulator AlpA